jgi:hypothetical protein
VEWFDTVSRRAIPGQTLAAGGRQSLTAPFPGPAALYIRQAAAGDATTQQAAPIEQRAQVDTSPSEPDNLVRNPSFEADLDADGYPDNWREYLPTGRRDQTSARAGVASLRVDGPSDDVYAEQPIRLKKSTRYTISAFVRAASPGGQGVWVRYAEIEPTTIVHNTRPINVTSDWTLVSSEFTTSEHYENGRLDIIWQLSSGTVWVDDVALCEGSGPCGQSR